MVAEPAATPVTVMVLPLLVAVATAGALLPTLVTVAPVRVAVSVPPTSIVMESLLRVIPVASAARVSAVMNRVSM